MPDALLVDGRPRRQAARIALRGRPTLYAELAVVGAWLALVAIDLSAGSTRIFAGAMGAMGAMPGMAPAVGASAFSAIVAATPMWALMSTAMMLPAALPAVQHVARNSLRWRRRRATAEFIGVYLGIWVAFGVGLLALVQADPRLARSHLVVALALAVAAAWQLTPAKRRALRGCHTSTPLPPRGWRASAGVGRFGLRNAGACVGSCWALMVVMLVAGAPELLWTVLLTAIVSTEKLARKPRRATRAAAGLLAGAAVVTGLWSVAGC